MLSTDVYNIMIDRLLGGNLPQGTVLNRRQIAAELGVSVAPVLEAFKRLEHEGYIRTIPRKGTMVCSLTKQDIQGHLILKEAIERAAAERYDGAVVRMHYDRLYQRAAAVDAAARERGVNSVETWRLDLDFHADLVALAGYEVLVNEFKRIAVPNLFYHVNRMLDNHGYCAHIPLLDALASDNREYALEQLSQHLRSSRTTE